jgi:hypothetical protein
LDEIARFVCHGTLPPEGQEEDTLVLLIVKRRVEDDQPLG